METSDAFGTGGFDWILTRTDLSVFPGVQHPCEGDWERFSGTLSLDAAELSVSSRRDFSFGRPSGEALTLKVSGASAIRTTDGGRIGLVGTTTVELAADSVLTLAADFDDLGDGKLVFTGEGRVIADAQLAGRVEVGAGVTFEMTAMPMTEVTDLTFDAASTLVLPESNESFYQLVALSATMTLPTETRVVIGSRDADEGVATSTGSFFEKKVVTVYDPDVYYMWESEGEKMFFPEIEGRDVVDVYVAGSVTSEFTYFGNKTTHYRFKNVLSSSVALSAVLFGGPTTFEVPLTATHSVGVMAGVLTVGELTTPTVTVSSGGEVRAGSIRGLDGLSEVTVARGGVLDLTGDHAMKLVLEDGAILKAVPGECLLLSEESTVSLEGCVSIDVSALDLTAGPVPLMSGNGGVCTLADLDRLRLLQDNAELRLVNGDLYVIAGAELVGPYERTLDGATTWNGEAWTDAKGTTFAWGDTATDWSDDVVLTLAGHSVVTVDVPVVVRKLSLVSSGSNDLAVVSDGTYAALAREWDFGAARGNVTFGLDVDDAKVRLSSVCTILGGVATNALLSIADDATVRFLHPGRGWRVGAPVRGVFEVVPMSAVEPFAIVGCPDDFPCPASDFEIRLVDADGAPLDMKEWGFEVRDGALLAIPPPVVCRATVTPSVLSWDDLEWTDRQGNPVQVHGGETFDEWRLVLGEDMSVADVNALADGHEVTIEVPRGRTLEVSGRNWETETIIGEGTLLLAPGTVTANCTRKGSAFAGKIDVQISVNAKYAVFGDTAAVPLFAGRPELSVTAVNPASSTQALILNLGIVGCPLTVRNFSGTAYVRSDYNKGDGLRVIDTLMTEDREFSGVFMNNGNRKASLTVRGDGTHALTLSGANATLGELRLADKGFVKLVSTGSWASGTVVVGSGCVLSLAGAKSFSSLTLEDGAVLAFAAEGTTLTVAAPVASGVVTVDPGTLAPTEAGVKLFGWTTAPTATFALRSDRTDCVIEKRTDGVYLTADAFVPVAGTDVKIPAAWVRSCPEYVKRAGGDLTEAVLLTTGKVAPDGHETALWEEYVAGTDPDDADDLFLAFIAITNGVPYLSWQPDLNTNGIRRIYTIYGRSDLASGSPWQTPTNVTHRFFKVGVRLP